MPESFEELVNDFSSLVGKKQITMPATEVIESGQHVSNPRMDPSVMNFIMMASIASQAVKVRKYVEDRTPTGLIQTFNVTATDDVAEVKLDYLAQSVSIINDDSANSVYVWVNSRGRPRHEIKHGETLDIDFEVHKIRYLYLQCDTGQSAAVRIVASD
jgi:hypothetical protein